jgi:hypothetical protein
MQKLVACLLIAASLLFAAVFVAPRFADGFLMNAAPLCAASEDDGCLEEVDAVVKEREHGFRKDFRPVRWHLKPKGSPEVTLRTPWLGDELDVGTRVRLQLWEGDPVAVRVRADEVRSLAWGTNRWILWAWAALALLLAGLTLFYHSLERDPDDDSPPVDAATAAGGVGLVTAVAVPATYAFYSAGGWFGVLLVFGVWVWLIVPIMIHGRRTRPIKGSRSRGLA